MTDTTVYLPRGSQGATAQLVSLKAEDVFNALDAAGIKWVLESMEEFQIRMLRTQVIELRHLLQQMNGQKEELVATVRRVVDENNKLRTELGDWDTAHADLLEEIEKLKAENHFLKGGKGKEIQE